MQGTINTSNTLIIHVNILEITSHIEELNHLMEDMQPMVCCITETHSTSDTDSEICINGYTAMVCYFSSRHTGVVAIIYVQIWAQWTVIIIILNEAFQNKYRMLVTRIQLCI